MNTSDNQKDAARKWRVNCTEIPKLAKGWGAYLHNKKGEMVAIIIPQDRPESEGLLDNILDGLNRTEYAADRVGVEETVEQICKIAELSTAGRHAITIRSILTRLISPDQSAVRELDVDAIWVKLQDISLVMLATNHGSPSCVNISKNDLRAALANVNISEVK
jgi:hypothetical protein